MKSPDAITLLLSRRLPPDDTLDLPVVALDAAARERTRLRLEVAGTRYAVLLEGGPPLQHGELLADALAPRLRVAAAVEPIAVARGHDPLLCLRAAWHLGNRHTPVQVTADGICLRPDHVLEEMLRGLGLEVQHEMRTFLPEAGAYHGAVGALLRGQPHTHGSGNTGAPHHHG